MAPTPVEKVISDRDRIESLIEHSELRLSGHSTKALTRVKVEQYLTSTIKLQESLDDAYVAIRTVADKADLPTHVKYHFDLCDRITEVICGLEEIKMKFPVTSSTPSTATTGTSSSTMQIRLPRLEIPAFSGNLQEWASFRDLFRTTIHANVSLSNVQKFAYLKSSLSGEAARLVQSMSVTDSSYDLAWSQLTTRYQNDREQLFFILKRLLSQPIVQLHSSTSLRELLDTTKECIRSLEVLQIPVSSWDAILMFIMFQRLDQTSKELWEQSLKDTSIPSLLEFTDFIEARARSLATVCSTAPDKSFNPRGQTRLSKAVHLTHHVSEQSNCKVCPTERHPLYQCSKFIQMSIPERFNIVKKGSCFNCLREGHASSKCPSKGTCKKCNSKHNTLLHTDKENNKQSSSLPTPEGISNPQPSNFHTADYNSIQQNMLATALVHIQDSQGQRQVLRALLDGGSTCSFISEVSVRRLGISRTRASTEVLGLSSTSLGTTKGMTSVILSPHFDDNVRIPMKLLILPNVTGLLPSYPCDPTVWPHLQGLELADPQFHKPSNVDILLGADVFWDVLLDGKRKGPKGSPVGIRTQLGWLIAGQLNVASNKVTSCYADVDLDKILQQFWEIESNPISKPLTVEEKKCEQHFLQTHRRHERGRYEVQLPFKDPMPELGYTRDLAVRRLKSLERRLAALPERKEEYIKFMDEYESMGHMKAVLPSEVISTTIDCCYIPHHFVIKESSTSTKLRVVFDASMLTNTKVSLNQSLMIGPTIQEPLINIITRFRKHTIAFTADITKMYRQILVAPHHADMQRILWRKSPDEPITDYRLLTVTYGTSPAPYLATRVLHQMAIDGKQSYPLASNIVLCDMYVDDVMSGASSEDLAKEIQHQLLTMMEGAGFPLRKWSSNSPAVLAALPPEFIESNTMLELNSEHTVKALGVYWNTIQDKFQFKISLNDVTANSKFTKRTLLSEVAKIFDPLGWLSPVIIRAKIMIQQLWKLELGWDELLPETIQLQWLDFRNNLNSIELISIDRCIIPGSTTYLNIIGFCDASEKAYAAVVYVCAYQGDSEPVISLVSSKTRVAPVKQVSLPRLELCGAVLLSDLMKNVKQSLKVEFQKTMAFTDSTVVLSWIQAHPSRWKTFVANRVTEIQESIPAHQWSHVSGSDNPADCASRGLDPSDLKSHPLWWNGPSWLRTWKESPTSADITDSDAELVNLEKKQEKIYVNYATQDSFILSRVSCLQKLLRYTAYIQRAIQNFFVRKQVRLTVYPLNEFQSGSLRPQEINQSLLTWIRIIQDQVFHDEIKCLQKNSAIPFKSRILSLNPFLDTHGIIRVGGRLRNSKLPAEQKTPILIPRHHQFTKLLIRTEHIKFLHAGAQLLLSIITRRFWIIGARDAIRHEIKGCVTCSRHAAVVQQQWMGDLPSSRIVPANPFRDTGVDYAGPFNLRLMAGRSKLTYKAYLAIFVCFKTRAVHLEVVSSLSTEAFLATFRRFISRRGKPATIHSDCGTNFVGAAAEIKQMYAMLLSDSHNQIMAKEMTNEGIEWKFNPAAAPHMGGLWEAGVKSVKFHLHRVIGLARLNFEEMTTVMSQIEACLNSRPLTPVSSDPNDLAALTPGHFLVGAPLTSLPDADLMDLKVGRLSRWQMMQQMTQQFWRRWSNEYVARMQQRPKWLKHNYNIKLNSLVLIKDERLPPMKWRLGRVISLHPGADDHVRVVSLKTSDGDIKRPISKICLLPIDPDQEAE